MYLHKSKTISNIVWLTDPDIGEEEKNEIVYSLEKGKCIKRRKKHPEILGVRGGDE